MELFNQMLLLIYSSNLIKYFCFRDHPFNLYANFSKKNMCMDVFAYQGVGNVSILEKFSICTKWMVPFIHFFPSFCNTWIIIMKFSILLWSFITLFEDLKRSLKKIRPGFLQYLMLLTKKVKYQECSNSDNLF